MTSEKKLGIWMDHANAHLMEYTDPIVTKVVTSNSTREEKEFTLQKGESFMHRKNQQQEQHTIKPLRNLSKIMMRFYYLVRPMRELNCSIF